MRNEQVAGPVAAAINGFVDSQALARKIIQSSTLCEFCGLVPGVVWEETLIAGQMKNLWACKPCATSCKDCGASTGEEHLKTCDLRPRTEDELSEAEEVSFGQNWERDFERGFNDAKEAKIRP